MKLTTKALTVLLASASFAVAAPAFSDESHHPETKATTASAAKVDVQKIEIMQANVKKMQQQLDRIAKAKTSDERQQAIATHMQTMQENMRMAGGMMNCPMMGQGMMGNQGMMSMMSGNDEMISKRMDMMEKRMDMMQMMMQNRMEGTAKPAN